MTDSIRVFDPGWRAFDQNGLLVPGALIKFYNAGTTTPKTVYSNAALSTSLSDTITCNASGAPAASDGTLVMVWTGIAAYKVEIYTAAGVLIPGMSYDNISGALDTSAYNVTATVAWEVVPISATGTIPGGNLGKLENTNPTAGQISRTLPTAASAGLGAYIWIRHDGTANATLVLSQGSDLIHARGDLGSRQCITLFEKGDAVLLVSDAVDWHAQFTPAIERNKMFMVKGLQSAPPSSPVAGDAYIVTGSPTGAWSSFSANDVVTADGNAGWYRQRPPYDCGWVAYSGGYYYRYIASAWRSEIASDTTTGTLTVATNADMEFGTSLTSAVTPGRAHYHPGVAKAWCRFTGVTTAGLAIGYNVSSVTRTSAGNYTVNFTNYFSSAKVTCVGMAKPNTANPCFVNDVAAGATSFAVKTVGVTGSGTTTEDAAVVNLTFYGDF